MTVLSICIPTYNFGRFIGETLQAILPQLRGEVELLIFDGGSTDDTPHIVGSLADSHHGIRYHRAARRGGIDADIIELVSLARGTYCWLVSADDIPTTDAVDKILRLIAAGEADIIFVEHTTCDFNMRLLGHRWSLEGIDGPVLFDSRERNQLLDYLARARSTEPFFSFLSTPVFRRSLWESVPVSAPIVGSCWIVAGKLLPALRDGCRLLYTAEHLLHKRGDNDSFLEHGVVNRYRLEIEGLRMVGEHVFGQSSPESIEVRRVLRSDLPLPYLLNARLKALQSPGSESMDTLRHIVRLHYDRGTLMDWLRIRLILNAPRTPLAALLQIRRLWKRVRDWNTRLFDRPDRSGHQAS